MSFNLNPLNNNTPQIRANRAQDGGAGNTGYFQQKREKENENEHNKSVFAEEPKDTLTLHKAEEFSYIEPTPLVKIVNFVKNLFKRLFNQ